jgi:hypothetical protein
MAPPAPLAEGDSVAPRGLRLARSAPLPPPLLPLLAAGEVAGRGRLLLPPFCCCWLGEPSS